MKKFTRNELIEIAKEMHEEGTRFSERYSPDVWKSRDWPTINDVIVYKVLDSYLKYLRLSDEYHEDKKATEHAGPTGVLGRLPPGAWKKT